MIVERQALSHLHALVGGSKILEEQICSSFKGCHATFSLKSVFFTRKVGWQSLIKLQSWAWDILSPTSRAKKWGIICLRNSSGSHSNLLYRPFFSQSNKFMLWKISFLIFCGSYVTTTCPYLPHKMIDPLDPLGHPQRIPWFQLQYIKLNTPANIAILILFTYMVVNGV